jgi:phage baseplate assembly protein W
MAFNSKQIFPIDLNKSKAVGVDIPFNSPGVFKSNFTTKSSLKNNLINFFLTNPGERPLNPSFGGGLRDFIFESINNDNITLIKEQTEEKIKNRFPMIKLERLKINEQPDNNIITVSIDYKIKRTKITDNIQIDFQ